jgi:hypothetical protein
MPKDDAEEANKGNAGGLGAREAIYRTESRRIFATLVRLLGDFDLAEESLHDGFRAAREQWPREGLPASPRGWRARPRGFRASRNASRASGSLAAAVKNVRQNVTGMRRGGHEGDGADGPSGGCMDTGVVVVGAGPSGLRPFPAPLKKIRRPSAPGGDARSARASRAWNR